MRLHSCPPVTQIIHCERQPQVDPVEIGDLWKAKWKRPNRTNKNELTPTGSVLISNEPSPLKSVSTHTHTRTKNMESYEDSALNHSPLERFVCVCQRVRACVFM